MRQRARFNLSTQKLDWVVVEGKERSSGQDTKGTVDGYLNVVGGAGYAIQGSIG